MPLYSARVAREGTDITLVAYGPMVKTCMDAATAAAEEGKSLEVIDLRSLSPLDMATLRASVEKTGRLVVVHEAPVFLGMGAEIAARVTEACFYSLEAPVLRVGGFDTPVPAQPGRGGLPARPRPGAGRRRPFPRVLRSPATMKQFKLPDVGEGLTEAEIVSWKVKPGDTVKVNEIVVEIETAKSLVELPSPFAGVVSELLVPEGTTVDVGTPIITVDDGTGAPRRPPHRRATTWRRPSRTRRRSRPPVRTRPSSPA